MFRFFRLLAVFQVLLLTAAAVHGNGKNAAVVVATTTSTDNSGLIDYLLPELEGDTGFKYKIVAVGTGKALRMGAAGDIDALLVHAMNSELEFIKAGHGIDRTPIMHNDFIFVGPEADAAVPENAESIGALMKSIADNKRLFVSRGDDSGTHKKELNLWREAGIAPDGEWYRQVGQGMGKALQIADELRAYTITDRGTWLFSRDNLDLEIILEGDEILYNQYSAIAVNPDRHDVNYAGAAAFIEWMTSGKAQSLINEYSIRGEQLFFANAR